jgi:dethiobiotin synthetase
MSRLRGVYVTGTDTDIGKTRVAAAIARAWSDGRTVPTIVKLVQTGIARSDEGDAQLAARWAGVNWRELGRFRAAADPWSAALAESNRPLRVAQLLAGIRGCAEPVIVEGTGGAAVPLNETETLTDVAMEAGLPAIIAIGLRLGCLNHALLTLSYLRERKIRVAGLVCVERWQPIDASYRNDVTRTLEPHAPLIGTVTFDHDPQRSAIAAAPLFAPFVEEEASSTTRS